jgi:hypothetical protein
LGIEKNFIGPKKEREREKKKVGEDRKAINKRHAGYQSSMVLYWHIWYQIKMRK